MKSGKNLFCSFFEFFEISRMKRGKFKKLKNGTRLIYTKFQATKHLISSQSHLLNLQRA